MGRSESPRELSGVVSDFLFSYRFCLSGCVEVQKLLDDRVVVAVGCGIQCVDVEVSCVDCDGPATFTAHELLVVVDLHCGFGRLLGPSVMLAPAIWADHSVIPVAQCLMEVVHLCDVCK